VTRVDVVFVVLFFRTLLSSFSYDKHIQTSTGALRRIYLNCERDMTQGLPVAFCNSFGEFVI
jgi:hypothetical protein